MTCEPEVEKGRQEEAILTSSHSRSYATSPPTGGDVLLYHGKLPDFDKGAFLAVKGVVLRHCDLFDVLEVRLHSRSRCPALAVVPLVALLDGC